MSILSEILRSAILSILSILSEIMRSAILSILSKKWVLRIPRSWPY